MLSNDIYEIMFDQDECWIVYESGAAMIVGSVNPDVALDC